MKKNVKVETVPGFPALFPTAGQLTGEALIGHMKTVPLDKDTAIMAVAMGLAMKELVERAKEYLTQRCARTASYTHSSGVTIKLDVKIRKDITSDKIEKLKAQIDTEKKIILDGKATPGAKINSTPYDSWTLVKKTAKVGEKK